jgi:hypothetical protein
MAFVIRMALRETRASWLRLVFFFTCVAIGVAAIVVPRSEVQNVRETLVREAREIVGADLVVQSTRPGSIPQLDGQRKEPGGRDHVPREHATPGGYRANNSLSRLLSDSASTPTRKKRDAFTS